MTKKFTFDDLQPRVEMLIEALQNRGSCASGLPYADGVSAMSIYYEDLLSKIRNKNIPYEKILQNLDDYKYAVLFLAKDNQRYRITKVLDALDFYMIKEYNKHNGNEE